MLVTLAINLQSFMHIVKSNIECCRYNQLLGIISSDPGVLQKLGEMYDSMGDKQQAFQFYTDVSNFVPFID